MICNCEFAKCGAKHKLRALRRALASHTVAHSDTHRHMPMTLTNCVFSYRVTIFQQTGLTLLQLIHADRAQSTGQRVPQDLFADFHEQQLLSQRCLTFPKSVAWRGILLDAYITMEDSPHSPAAGLLFLTGLVR